MGIDRPPRGATMRFGPRSIQGECRFGMKSRVRHSVMERRRSRRFSISTREARVSSQKLLRCEIRSRGNGGQRSERYIPLEIFGLWEYLMTHRHDFEIIQPRASLWLDMEDSPEAAYQDHAYERVTEVTAYVYSGRDDMFTPGAPLLRDRRVRAAQIDLPRALHREGARIQTRVRERPGIWLHRDPETGPRLSHAVTPPALPGPRRPARGPPLPCRFPFKVAVSRADKPQDGRRPDVPIAARALLASRNGGRACRQDCDPIRCVRAGSGFVLQASVLLDGSFHLQGSRGERAARGSMGFGSVTGWGRSRRRSPWSS